MTPREPDRFEEKAREVWASCLHEGDSPSHEPIAAALRQAADEALERAAQAFAEAPTTQHSGAAVASVLRYLTRESVPRPAAAPAAEIGTCANFWHPGHGKEIHTRREAVGDVSAVHADYVNDSGCINWRPAPPSEPAAPEKEIANLLGRGHVRNPREGEPGDAETYSSPAPLLPRVLAALEQDARAGNVSARRLESLAAELRAYIAEREGGPRLDGCYHGENGHPCALPRVAELETALRDALNAAHHHVQAGQHWICSEPFACEEECPCAKLAARAATKGEGT